MTLHTQWLTMGLMVGSGWMMGVILDLYRVLKARFRLRGWVVSLVDLLYWTVAAGLVFGLLMWSNWGELRFYIFVGVFLGFAAYHAWFSRWVTQLIRWLVRVVEEILRFLVKALYITVWAPLTILWSGVWNLLHGLLGVLRWILRILLWLFSPVGRWLHPWINRTAKALQPLTGPVRQAVRGLRRLFPSRGNRKDE